MLESRPYDFLQTQVRPMTVKKTLVLFALLGVAVVAAPVHAAEPLQPTTQSRGTVKVRPRFFDPFAVKQSRLQMDPFGFFTLQNANPFSVSVPGTASPAAKSTVAVGSIAGPTTAPVAAAAPAPAAAATGSDIDSAPVIAVSAARVPFRPPVRSPFRPPPRPPF